MQHAMSLNFRVGRKVRVIPIFTKDFKSLCYITYRFLMIFTPDIAEISDTFVSKMLRTTKLARPESAEISDTSV